LLADLLSLINADIADAVRIQVEPHWQKKKQDAQAYQAARQDKEKQDALKAQAEQHDREERKNQAERDRIRRNEAQNAKREAQIREKRRKEQRPESLEEMKEVSSGLWSPVGTEVWLYPKGDDSRTRDGLKFKVLSDTPGDSRLTLVSPVGLRVRKVRVSKYVDRANPSITTFHEMARLGNIPFYFDGRTMGIVFSQPVPLASNEAIYIDLPRDTDIENISGCGTYGHWLDNFRPSQVFMSESGAYSRGPRLFSEH
jgi:hypothetical protein